MAIISEDDRHYKLMWRIEQGSIVSSEELDYYVDISPAGISPTIKEYLLRFITETKIPQIWIFVYEGKSTSTAPTSVTYAFNEKAADVITSELKIINKTAFKATGMPDIYMFQRYVETILKSDKFKRTKMIIQNNQ
jgi:hypothetical protein